MKASKIFLSIFLSLSLLFSVSAITFNTNGDFTVELTSPQEVQVSSESIQASYTFKLTNNLEETQTLEISPTRVVGFDILQNPQTITLLPEETKELEFIYRSNSAFEYKTDIQSSDTIKISLQGSYQGKFDFPILIESSTKDTVSFTLRIDILPKEQIQDLFIVRLASTQLSPIQPLRFTVSAEEISQQRDVEIKIFLNDQEIGKILDTFSPSKNYNIYEKEISPEISPGNYEFKISLKYQREDLSYVEWLDIQTIPVIKYNPAFDVKEDINIGLFTNTVNYKVTNKGNTLDTFKAEVNVPFWKSLFFSSNLDYNIENKKANLQIEIDKGETQTISYKFNYISLVIFLITLIIIIIYLTLRKLSNPLAVETKLYEIKKSTHEGVKSLKIRIGFENIKAEEIENLKIIYRMPTYLTVKDNSFLLTPPKQVLKGTSQYKMVWEFKRFEKEDARILGFTMVNARGILGDVRLEDLEIEVKIKGKVRKYYKSFPVIKG